MPTGSDDYAENGENVRDTLNLVSQAQEVLTRAVLHERARGASWKAIAEWLGIDRQPAYARYGEAEREWNDSWHEPFHPSSLDRVRSLRLHPAAYEPTATGQKLDEWAHRHGQGEHAVSGGLPTLSLPDETGQVLDGLNHLYREGTPTDLAARLRLTERKAALLDRIAAEEGRPEAAARADEARALAAQLRAEIGGDA